MKVSIFFQRSLLTLIQKLVVFSTLFANDLLLLKVLLRLSTQIYLNWIQFHFENIVKLKDNIHPLQTE